VSRERARRRAERLAAREREKGARARTAARRQRRRALLRSLAPHRRSAGRLYRRSRGQRAGIVLLPLVAAVAVWLLVPELALRLVLLAMIVLVLPALVVVVLGRRADRAGPVRRSR
jgi:Flp pilus assembly protein TadB